MTTIEASTACRVCGKTASQPHTAATREAHVLYLARVGSSLMCPSPQARSTQEDGQ